MSQGRVILGVALAVAALWASRLSVPAQPAAERATEVEVAVSVSALKAAGQPSPEAKVARSSKPRITLSPARKARLGKAAADFEKRRFGDPDLAEQFYVNRRTGPIITRGPNPTTGARTLTSERYFEAMQQMMDMPRYSSGDHKALPSGKSMRETAAAPGDALGPWTSLGPANQGGRTRALLINPGNPDIMYAGGVAGGVWKSTDGGENWTTTTDLMTNLAVVTLAFDPSNLSVIYAGTGEGVGNVDAIRGAGIFKSRDAGTTWSQLVATNNSTFHYTMKILVSPRNTQRLWVGTRAGILRSIDAGATWSTVLNASAVNGCTDMAMQVTGSTGHVFVSCGTTSSQGAIYRAQDDNVSTFASIMSLAGQGRSSIAVAPSAENVVYVMSSQGTAGAGPGRYGLHGVYRSTANGDPGTFVTQRQGNVAPVDTAQKINQLLLSNPVIALLTECGFGTSGFSNQGWYDNVLAVDPVNSNIVWAGGVDLWRSDNGGVDWGTSGYWWFDKGVDPQYHHADQHGIVFHPQYDGAINKVLFSASDGGVERIDDARAPVNTSLAQLCGTPVALGPTWIDRNNGYITTQFYDGAAYPDGQTYFGGLQDNGTQRGSSAGPNWTMLNGGDGGYVAVDTLADGDTGNDVLFLETTRLSLMRSVNGGVTFSSATTGITEGTNNFLFIAPFTMNEATKQHLWMGGFFVWRTTNQATGWSQASAITCGSGSISAVAAHSLDGNRVLVGMSDGCYHYNHAALSGTLGTAWPGGGVIAPGGYISSVAWDPNNLDVAYATVSGFGVTNLLKSTDGGVSWAARVGAGPTALPQIPALSVVVNPADSQQVFVGTDLGVFTSVDGGASWHVENTPGFANVPVETLRFNATSPRALFAFTHGRGAWRVALSTIDLTITKATSSSFQQGGVASYTLTVNNVGSGATSAAYAISDTMPAGLTISGTPGGGPNWNCTASTSLAVSCTSSTAISGGQSASPVTLSVNIAANAAASVTNTAAVAGGGETNTANNSGSVTTPVTVVTRDLTITKTTSSTFQQGGTASYTLIVNNVGNGATNAAYSISDTMPAGLTISGTPGGGPNWNCTASTSLAVSCTSSTAISGGQSASAVTFAVNIAANAAASITNTAAVAGGGETNTANNSGSVSTPVATVSAPTVTSPVSGAITASTATLGGNVVSDGGGPITERGIALSPTVTNAAPLIGGTGVITLTAGGSTGQFTAAVSGLSPATGYSFRAYATNAAGTTYSGVATFSTLSLGLINAFTASSVLVSPGGTSTLSWSAAAGATLTLNAAGVSGPLGSQVVNPTVTTTYTLGATSVAGTESRIVTVQVNDGTASLLVPTITAPTDGQVVVVTGVGFNWTTVPNATGYGIRVLDGTSGNVLFSGSLLGGSSASSLISLPAGSYRFAVRACANGFEAPQCGRYETSAFTVSPAGPSGAPAVIFPTQGANLIASTQTLTWTAVTPNPGLSGLTYEVLLRDLAAGTTALQITAPSPNLSTIFTMKSSTLYELKVRACQAGCGPYSTPVTFLVTLPPIPTLAPGGASCSVSGGNSLTCEWGAVANADAYQVQVVQPPPSGPGGGALTTAARQVSATTVTLPVPAGAATVFISACNGDGCGPNTTFPITAAGPNSSQPSLGTPMAGTVVAGPGVLFTWNRVPGDSGSNTSYRLFVQDLSRQSTALDVYTTSNFYSAFFRAEGARYDALVVSNPGFPGAVTGPSQGFNVAGASATSPTLVSPPHNSTLPSGNIQLGWSPAPGATLYQYFVAILGQGNASAGGVTPGLLAQLPLTGTGSGTVYSGIVRACPAGATCVAGSDTGWGPWSNAPGGPGVTNFTVVP